MEQELTGGRKESIATASGKQLSGNVCEPRLKRRLDGQNLASNIRIWRSTTESCGQERKSTAAIRRVVKHLPALSLRLLSDLVVLAGSVGGVATLVALGAPTSLSPVGPRGLGSSGARLSCLAVVTASVVGGSSVVVSEAGGLSGSVGGGGATLEGSFLCLELLRRSLEVVELGGQSDVGAASRQHLAVCLGSLPLGVELATVRALVIPTIWALESRRRWVTLTIAVLEWGEERTRSGTILVGLGRVGAAVAGGLELLGQLRGRLVDAEVLELEQLVPAVALARLGLVRRSEAAVSVVLAGVVVAVLGVVGVGGVPAMAGQGLEAVAVVPPAVPGEGGGELPDALPHRHRTPAVLAL